MRDTDPPTMTRPARMPTHSIRNGITSAPAAIPSVSRLSKAPNTRPITSVGATRWMIV